jgi:hypothetical protein
MMMIRFVVAVAVVVCAWGTSWPVGCVPFGWLGQPTRPPAPPLVPQTPRYQCRATPWSACQ